MKHKDTCSHVGYHTLLKHTNIIFMYSLKISIQEKYNIKFVHRGVIVPNWPYFYKYFDESWFCPIKYKWILTFFLYPIHLHFQGKLPRDKNSSCLRRIASGELHSLPLKILGSRCFLVFFINTIVLHEHEKWPTGFASSDPFRITAEAQPESMPLASWCQGVICHWCLSVTAISTVVLFHFLNTLRRTWQESLWKLPKGFKTHLLPLLLISPNSFCSSNFLFLN